MDTSKLIKTSSRLNRRYTKQSGLTLVEILIGTVLSLFLIGSLLQLSQSTRNNNQISSSLTELQENGRFAVEQMVNALRYRGFQGCLTSKDEVEADGESESDTSVYVTQADGLNIPSMDEGHLRGYDVSAAGTWAPLPTHADMTALSGTIDPTPRAGSDIISLTYANPRGVPLAESMTKRDDNLTIEHNNFGFEQGDVVFIGNCTSIESFRISNEVSEDAPFVLEHAASMNALTGNPNKTRDNVSASTNTFLDQIYETGDSAIRLYNSDTYYVADTGRNGPQGGDIYALYKLDAQGDTTELIEGIENIQILYGEETDATTNTIRYVPASTGDLDMKKVKSIQISMLVHSISQSRQSYDQNTYSLLDQDIAHESTTITHQGNKMMRRTYTTTVNLRNQF